MNEMPRVFFQIAVRAGVIPPFRSGKEKGRRAGEIHGTPNDGAPVRRSAQKGERPSGSETDQAAGAGFAPEEREGNCTRTTAAKMTAQPTRFSIE